MNRQRREDQRHQDERRRELHEPNARKCRLSVSHGNAPQSLCWSPAEPILERLRASHAALPLTHHEKAEQPTRTEKEKPGEHPTDVHNASTMRLGPLHPALGVAMGSGVLVWLNGGSAHGANRIRL